MTTRIGYINIIGNRRRRRQAHEWIAGIDLLRGGRRVSWPADAGDRGPPSGLLSLRHRSTSRRGLVLDHDRRFSASPRLSMPTEGLAGSTNRLSSVDFLPSATELVHLRKVDETGALLKH
ncbi:MAG: hypothetical protein HZA66_20635 [Rhodopseudomonas palustris]|uniref:Uncharacterized protein n=1 Tax=Rhodopseudomonas palustris TaxID=1076 RepID=A0A933VW95_RHOPL|nr:hypothetical protein [Rhodopseudomonas palustris]